MPPPKYSPRPMNYTWTCNPCTLGLPVNEDGSEPEPITHTVSGTSKTQLEKTIKNFKKECRSRRIEDVTKSS